MTTVYVNSRLGVVLTDTRTTSTTYNELFGFILNERDEYFDNATKAMYLHDRVFAISGCTTETDKIARYIAFGEPIVPEPKKEKVIGNCVLVDKNWVLQILVENGKTKKIFYPYPKNWSWGTGSGWDALRDALKVYEEPTLDEVIAAFKTVHKSDKYTNDQIKIYKI